MATTWFPRPSTTHPKSWLLTDGTIIQEPLLQESASGIKVRVAEFPQVSAYKKDMDELIYNTVQQVAAKNGAPVWMAIGNLETDCVGQGYSRADCRVAKLHMLKGKRGYGDQTVLWWLFKHPTLPIEAELAVKVINQYGSSSIAMNQQTVTTLAMPLTSPAYAAAPRYVIEQNAFGNTENAVIGIGDVWEFREFLKRGTSWDAEHLLGGLSFPNERLAIIDLLDRARKIDQLASIDIPDLRDQDVPAWLTLDLVDSNVNQEFIAELVSYLEGAPIVEEAKHHYEEMLRTMRSLGLVLDAKGANDFLAALGSGDQEALTIKINDGGTESRFGDHSHILTMHLPSGTFIIGCQARDSNSGEVAHKWEEATMLAALTGKEDELLAYARRHAEQEHAKRVEKILRDRKAMLPKTPEDDVPDYLSK
jgi:hypothetical protein